MVRVAAQQAARADAKRGDHYHGAMLLVLLVKAMAARQQGQTKEQFLASLLPEERAYLDSGKPQ